MTETEQTLVNERIFDTITSLSTDIKDLVSSNHELAKAQGVLSTEVKHLCAQLSVIEKNNKEAITKFEKALIDQGIKFQQQINDLKEIQKTGCPAIYEQKAITIGRIEKFELIAENLDERIQKIEANEAKIVWVIVLSVLGGILGLLGLKTIKV